MTPDQYKPTQQSKQRAREVKKEIDKRLLQSAFNTKTKREYNKTHKNQIP